MHVHEYECERSCMNTKPRLCCYRMELWPLSCQHSCVAIGPRVHSNSHRHRDNIPHPSSYLPLLLLGVTMPISGSTQHPETDAPTLLSVSHIYQHPEVQDEVSQAIHKPEKGPFVCVIYGSNDI